MCSTAGDLKSTVILMDLMLFLSVLELFSVLTVLGGCFGCFLFISNLFIFLKIISWMGNLNGL